jgi:mono/diheme cytochrome c family protein
MRFHFPAAVLIALGSCTILNAKITPEQIKQLPPPTGHSVDFSKEVKPIFESSCIKCHGRGKDKGGLRLDTRETLLKGGDSGATIVLGKSAESYLVELVQGFDPDNSMPKKGSKLTPEQIGVLRAWIDQGAKWDAGVTFGKLEPVNLKPRRPEMPAGSKEANPIDRFLQPYFATHRTKQPQVVSDRIYARRVYLDVIGLLPAPDALEAFERNKRPDKRQRLVRSLLADNANYATHWMTFWNDMLRNDYRGTGYIDGGRKQITAWLYSALATNMPYDQFVAQLINPKAESEGFTKGIVWRGAVNASQTPQMQAAQGISQVFMGVNLKCASCHDSFINDLTLADAYGLAGVYADGALEMVRCDKPTGKLAELKFIYPELGQIDAKADKPARLKKLADIITGRQDARLTRTLVNRFWQRFMGRGLIEPVDEMEKAAWNPDLLDWLAEDLADHNYDIKSIIECILTSRAYQMPAVNFDEKDSQDYVFTGPLVRRMSAEQFRDALGEVTGIWYDQPVAQIDYTIGLTNQQANAPFAAKWIWSQPGAATAAKPETVYFRKTVVLDRIPKVAIAIAGADNSYTLYVNGKKVVAGKNYAQLDRADIRLKLVKGANYFAIAAVNEGDSPNPAGAFLYVYARSDDKSRKIMDFGTDSSWSWSTNKVKGWEKPGFTPNGWLAAAELGNISIAPWNLENQFKIAMAAPESFGKVRAALVNADTLQVALGRPNREQVVTTRLSAATTLQALELTNGRELSDLMQRGSQKMMAEMSGKDLVSRLYVRALGRNPTADELKMAREVVGEPLQPAGVEDLLWAVTMLPEFQLIY